MDGRLQETGTHHEAACHAEAQAPAPSLWLAQVRTWLDALNYRPERRYMRGQEKPVGSAAGN
jgi:hypothetical protein